MKRITALALALCMLVLLLPALGTVGLAAEVALPYVSKMASNMPTDTFGTDGALNVTFHGNWDAVTYPANNYTPEARLRLNSLINIVNINGVNSASDAFWGVDGSAPGTYTAVRARNGNAYWGGASSLNTPATYIGGWRYTAEYKGTVTLSFGAIRQIENTVPVYVAAFVDGKMVWPTVDGTVYDADAENPYGAWQVIGSTTSVADSINGDAKLAGLAVEAGDAIEFLIAGNGSYQQNKAVVQPIVTYTDAEGGTVAPPSEEPDEPKPDEPTPPTPPIVEGVYVTMMSENLPTNTYTEDGNRMSTFAESWKPIAYPSGFYGVPSAMLELNSIVNTTSGIVDAFYAPDGMWQFESAPVVRIQGGNDYWGDAGTLGCKSTHTVGWQYTAEHTGVANIVFEKLCGLGRGKACYVAVFVNGVMVWPTAGGAAEGTDGIAYENWYAVSGKEDLAATVNADPLLANLVLSKGDTVEFMLGGAAGSTIFSANTVTMKPIVAYTSYIEAPKPGSASIALGEAFALNLYVDPDSVMEGATDLGAYINGTFAPAVDGCVRVEGIAAKNLIDKIKIRPACKLNGQEIVGEEIQVSAVDVLMQYVRGEDVSAEVKNLAIATLNYATAAQDFFGYGIDGAANDGLSAEQKKVTYTGTYESILAKSGDASANRATLHSASLILGDTVGMKFVFANITDGFAANYKVALLDADGKLVASATPTLCEGQTTSYKVIFDGILPTEWNTAYTVAVISAGDTGETPTPVGETLTYSVTSYLARITEESVAMRLTLVPAMYALYEAAVAYEAAENN